LFSQFSQLSANGGKTRVSLSIDFFSREDNTLQYCCIQKHHFTPSILEKTILLIYNTDVRGITFPIGRRQCLYLQHYQTIHYSILLTFRRGQYFYFTILPFKALLSTLFDSIQYFFYTLLPYEALLNTLSI
jgi:hypothetical protein